MLLAKITDDLKLAEFVTEYKLKFSGKQFSFKVPDTSSDNSRISFRQDNLTNLPHLRQVRWCPYVWAAAVVSGRVMSYCPL